MIVIIIVVLLIIGYISLTNNVSDKPIRDFKNRYSVLLKLIYEIPNTNYKLIHSETYGASLRQEYGNNVYNQFDFSLYSNQLKVIWISEHEFGKDTLNWTFPEDQNQGYIFNTILSDLQNLAKDFMSKHAPKKSSFETKQFCVSAENKIYFKFPLPYETNSLEKYENLREELKMEFLIIATEVFSKVKSVEDCKKAEKRLIEGLHFSLNQTLEQYNYKDQDLFYEHLSDLRPIGNQISKMANTKLDSLKDI